MTACEKENTALRELLNDHKEQMTVVQKTLTANGKKLDQINGTVRRHKFKHFPDIFKRIRTLEDTDKIEEGIEIGKTTMSKSTKNTIAIVGIVITCFVLGSGIFLNAQKKLSKSVIEQMSIGMGDKNKGSDALKNMEIIIARIEGLEKKAGK